MKRESEDTGESNLPDAASVNRANVASERKAIESLQGEWTLVSRRDNGKVTNDFQDYKLIFDGTRLTTKWKTSGSGPMQTADSVRFTVNPAIEPSEMNWIGGTMLVQSIYDVDGDQLKIAYFSRPEIDRPRRFTFSEDAPPNGLAHLLWEFRRTPMD